VEIQNLKHHFSLPNMILYAGSTWDWHKIHYDQNYLEKNSIPKPVVDGQVFGALIVKQIQNSISNFSRVRKMQFNYKNMVFQDEEIEIKSTSLTNWTEGEQVFFEISSTIYVGDRVIVLDARTVVEIVKN
jgi:hydroxyacyl-ACP dehydratase HTD2-like protein with hotdog domain|tara:strand:- start:492 stop:881 length:390 start_codon:yes stop_codon:yes gene_type:complete